MRKLDELGIASLWIGNSISGPESHVSPRLETLKNNGVFKGFVSAINNEVGECRYYPVEYK